MSIEPIADRLNEFSIFGGIDAATLAKLDDLFATCAYPVGACIIEEGSRGNRLYIITAGAVTVSMRRDVQGRPDRTDDQDGDLLLATLRTGDTFGEMELLDTQQRSATVVAIEPTETLELTNMGLLKLFQRDPETFRMLMMNLARDLSRRLRTAGRKLASLGHAG